MEDNMFVPSVGVVLLYEDAKAPARATALSACYDLFSYLKEGTVVTVYDGYNTKYEFVVGPEQELYIPPFCRCLVPTGIKFRIPPSYSIRVHPRSGNSLKYGLTLANCEGVIDADYPEQTYVLLKNDSFVTRAISHLDRIAQMELVEVIDISLSIVEDFGPISDRISGLGSTGK